jgi:hypothetical protein
MKTLIITPWADCCVLMFTLFSLHPPFVLDDEQIHWVAVLTDVIEVKYEATLREGAQIGDDNGGVLAERDIWCIRQV